MIHLLLYIVHNISCNCRDFQKVDEILLTPVIEALGPVANISVESQVPNGFFLEDIRYSSPSEIELINLSVDYMLLCECRFYTIHQSPHFLIGMVSWRVTFSAPKICLSLYAPLAIQICKRIYSSHVFKSNVP